MIRKNVLVFLMLIAVTAASIAFYTSFAWSTSSFDDSCNQKINAGLGTIEFRVKMLKDVSKDPHDHCFLLAVSSDTKEFYRIIIVEDQIIVWRDFGGCLRAAFSGKHNFKVGAWYDIKVAWNQESTKFYIDNREIPKLGIFSGQDESNAFGQIRVGPEDCFVIDNFRTYNTSNVRVERADQEFVRNSSCPNLPAILKEPAQEQYRGISLRHFPDQAARDKAKSYIALLPADFAASIKGVVYVEDARFPKGGEAGLADSQSGNAILKGSYALDPNVFFHELAHLYDEKQSICLGVPNEKSEWAAISGTSCYYGGADMYGFWAAFQKTKVGNAFLQPQGGQCPSEDLAIWTAAVYDFYLKGRSFADMLNLSSPKYSPKNKQKLDFLLNKGFFSREMYNKVTSAEK